MNQETIQKALSLLENELENVDLPDLKSEYIVVIDDIKLVLHEMAINS